MIVVIGLTGYTGRMERAIACQLDSHPSACLGGGLARFAQQTDSDESPMIVTDNPQDLFPNCDVIVDFSHPSATATYARLAAQAGKAFLSGTTGLDADAFTVLQACARTIPVLYAPNTSLSLAIARRTVETTARLLKDQEYDIAITDKHHRWKRDAPSGTALALGEAVRRGNEGRHSPTYASIRAGAIIGEHEVLFAGPGETIEIRHQVNDRRVFARGAIQAAIWLAGQSAGYYSMDDVLDSVA